MSTTGKDRHLDFYAEEATDRLARSATARRIARTAVGRWRLPGTRYSGPRRPDPAHGSGRTPRRR